MRFGVWAIFRLYGDRKSGRGRYFGGWFRFVRRRRRLCGGLAAEGLGLLRGQDWQAEGLQLSGQHRRRLWRTGDWPNDRRIKSGRECCSIILE